MSEAVLFTRASPRRAVATIARQARGGLYSRLLILLMTLCATAIANAQAVAASTGAAANGAAANGAAAATSILVLGDSLSAAYGIPRESGWVSLLEQKLTQQKLTNGNVAVVNASISGETTDGGLARLPALLQKHKPALVVIELGANDGLRGFQIRRLRDNLEQLVRLSQASGAKVLLVGIKIPPNYGLRYTSDFYESFTLLAGQYKVPMVPFLLEGVATDPELMQDDRLHPRAEAQPKILNTVWPYLQKML